MTHKMKEKLGALGEWLSIVGPIFALFLYIHHENVHLTERLDNHIEAINRRADCLNNRLDDLHTEFYELLKEMRK
mgnify:CR=1 FL=1